MAFVSGPSNRGAVEVDTLIEHWDSGECIVISAAHAGIYLTPAEAITLREQLGAALEKVGCAPVAIEVSDESEEGTPA